MAPKYQNNNIGTLETDQTASKCSVHSTTQSSYSQKPSHSNIALCKSFDQCSTCRKFIFSKKDSCVSFEVCNKCKNIDSSHVSESEGDCTEGKF